MSKFILSSITISFFVVLIGGYYLTYQPSNQREKYEESILLKAKTLGTNIIKNKEKPKVTRSARHGCFSGIHYDC